MVAVLLIFLLGVYAIMRSSTIQTYLTHKATDYLENKLHTEVRIGSVDFELFKTFVLNDVFIRDLHKDTLLYAKTLKLNVAYYNLQTNKFVLNNLAIRNTRFNLVQYKNEHELNFQFIADAFDTGDTTTKKSKAFDLTVYNVE